MEVFVYTQIVEFYSESQVDHMNFIKSYMLIM